MTAGWEGSVAPVSVPQSNELEGGTVAGAVCPPPGCGVCVSVAQSGLGVTTSVSVLQPNPSDEGGDVGSGSHSPGCGV